LILSIIETKLISRLAKMFYSQHLAFLKEGRREGGEGGFKSLMDLDADEWPIIMEEHRAILRALLQHDPERQIQNFIRRTRGARARFIKEYVQNGDDQDFLGKYLSSIQ
jgi:hypothetical protein